MIVRSSICLIALALFNVTTAFGKDPNLAALRMEQLFFKGCVAPILREQRITEDQLKKLSKELGFGILSKPEGQGWMATDAPVTLSKQLTTTGDYYACNASFLTATGAGKAVNFQEVNESFERWLKNESEKKKVVEILRCHEKNGNYRIVAESRTMRSRPVRIGLSYFNSLGYMVLLAGEISGYDADPPAPCY